MVATYAGLQMVRMFVLAIWSVLVHLLHPILVCAGNLVNSAASHTAAAAPGRNESSFYKCECYISCIHVAALPLRHHQLWLISDCHTLNVCMQVWQSQGQPENSTGVQAPAEAQPSSNPDASDLVWSQYVMHGQSLVCCTRNCDYSVVLCAHNCPSQY